MATPTSKITTSALSSLTSTTLGDLKPYQIDQVVDVLSRLNWDRGSNKDVSVQPTINTIVTSLGSNEP